MNNLAFIVLSLLVFPFFAEAQSIDLNNPPQDTVHIFGEFPGSQAGSTVKGIGDFNGDGNEPDLLIGAPGSDGVFIVWAKSGLQKYPLNIDLSNLVFKGRSYIGELGSRFGAAAAAVGDFNRDGRDDIAVGAPQGGNNGKIFIIKGSFGMFGGIDDDPNLLTIHGSAGERIGEILPHAREFNQDSFPDIIIPSTELSFLSSSYLIYGSNIYSASEIATNQLNPSQTLLFSGLDRTISPIQGHVKAINYIGDFTGNGYPDLAVYSGISSQEPNAAEIHIIPGGDKPVGEFFHDDMPDNAITVRVKLFSPMWKNIVNYMAGEDVNGDGFNDLILGFPLADLDGQEASGVLAVIPGAETIPNVMAFTNPDTDPLILIPLHAPDIKLYKQLSFHNTQMALGYPMETSPFNGMATGAVKIVDLAGLKGPFTLSSIDDFAQTTIHGRNEEDRLGISLEFLGDVNKDGEPEILIGTQDNDTADSVVAYVVSPSQAPTHVMDWSLYE